MVACRALQVCILFTFENVNRMYKFSLSGPEEGSKSHTSSKLWRYEFGAARRIGHERSYFAVSALHFSNVLPGSLATKVRYQMRKRCSASRVKVELNANRIVEVTKKGTGELFGSVSEQNASKGKERREEGMKHRNTLLIFLLVSIVRQSLSRTCQGSAVYNVSIRLELIDHSSTTSPVPSEPPTSVSFSQILLTTHNENSFLFKPNDFVSPAVQSLATTHNASQLISSTFSNNTKSHHVLPRISNLPAGVPANPFLDFFLNVDTNHTLFSAIASVNSSTIPPNTIIGIANRGLCNELSGNFSQQADMSLTEYVIEKGVGQERNIIKSSGRLIGYGRIVLDLFKRVIEGDKNEDIVIVFYKDDNGVDESEKSDEQEEKIPIAAESKATDDTPNQLALIFGVGFAVCVAIVVILGVIYGISRKLSS